VGKVIGRIKMMRAKINRSRKAFLFTLGFLIATLYILSFARFVSNESEEDKAIFQTVAVTSRLEDIDSSLQKSMRDAFFSYSDISIAPDNMTIAIEEPFPNSISELESSLAMLKNLSESAEKGLSMDLGELFSQLPLFIYPQNVAYIHNYTNNEVLLSFPADAGSAVSKYRAEITVSENVSCSWSYIPGDFSYELDVVSPKESGCDQDSMIDLDAGAAITMTSQSNPQNRITITLESSVFRIRMDDNSTFSAGLGSYLEFRDAPEEVWLGSSVIDLRYDAFDLRRTGGARLI